MVVIPEAVERLSGIHNHRSTGVDTAAMELRGSWLWIPGSRSARPGMTACFLLALCLFASAAFALDFPQLTGRVVD